MLLLDYMQDSDTEKWETPTYEEINHVHIQLTKGLFAKVSVEDFDRVNQFKWSATVRKTVSYGTRRSSDGKNHLLHRFILNAQVGDVVDHKNRDGTDNRRENLRIVSHGQNHQNRSAKSTSKSMLKGVNWIVRDKKWSARIFLDKKSVLLGIFANEIDAARAYDVAAMESFGDFACINFGRSEYTPEMVSAVKTSMIRRDLRLEQKIKGLYWNKKKSLWTASILPPDSTLRNPGGDRRRLYLGSSKDQKTAALIYDAAARRMHGPGALVNYPEVASV